MGIFGKRKKEKGAALVPEELTISPAQDTDAEIAAAIAVARQGRSAPLQGHFVLRPSSVPR